MVDVGDNQVLGKVIKRLRDQYGRPVDIKSENALTDSRDYKIRLPDGSSRELTYDQIVMNLFR